ncbi:MAG TPA: DUF2530 domain-containing protein [Streptosporangiaceae bacterium]|jgi:ABC-type nickel/cobalt efflux system permease component RcnA
MRSPSRTGQARPGPSRQAPPPLEGDDRLITGIVTAGWAIALLVLLLVRQHLAAGDRWWIWTCSAGLALGLFALWYVPVLKRSRARAASKRAAQHQDD